jgi:hypothetical protein
MTGRRHDPGPWRALIPIPDAFVEGDPPRMRDDADHAKIDRLRRHLDGQAPTGYVLHSEQLVKRRETGIPNLPEGIRYGLVRIYERTIASGPVA